MLSVSSAGDYTSEHVSDSFGESVVIEMLTSQHNAFRSMLKRCPIRKQVANSCGEFVRVVRIGFSLKLDQHFGRKNSRCFTDIARQHKPTRGEVKGNFPVVRTFPMTSFV